MNTPNIALKYIDWYDNTDFSDFSQPDCDKLKDITNALVSYAFDKDHLRKEASLVNDAFQDISSNYSVSKSARNKLRSARNLLVELLNSDVLTAIADELEALVETHQGVVSKNQQDKFNSLHAEFATHVQKHTSGSEQLPKLAMTRFSDISEEIKVAYKEETPLHATTIQNIRNLARLLRSI